MEYVNLGKAGIKVSRICLGCYSLGNDAEWKIELDEARKVVRKAIDVGITFFDTANSYSTGRSEEILGECLHGYREDAVIATKVYFPMGHGPNNSGLSRRHVMQQIKRSLQRLQTDRVDLYQIHRWDYQTPIEETLKVLDDIVRQEMAHYIGASSMYSWQFLESLHTSEMLGLEKFVSMQNHYNLVYREEEREMIPLCKSRGIALLAWSPLARGFLTGKYRRAITPDSSRFKTDEFLAERYFKPEDYDVLEAAEALAKQKQVSVTQIAIAWLLQKEVTSAIIGAKRPEHIEEAVKALDLRINPDEIRLLEKPYRPHAVLGHK